MEATRKRKRSDYETSIVENMDSNRLLDRFFNVPCIELAKNLLGTVLVRRLENNIILKGKIVETECYLGGEDKASHSFNGKITAANEPMFMKPGVMYVYLTYGMYHCLNISSYGHGAAVLLRALEPLQGTDTMAALRIEYGQRVKKNKDAVKNSNSTKLYKIHELCNGPSKLCMSFLIDKATCNKMDITSSPDIWIEPRVDDIDESDIVNSKRIGIDSVGLEWANKLLRFYVRKNTSVSKIDTVRENLM